MPRFQEGIYWDHGQTPGACFHIVFLRAAEGQTARTVSETLAKIWAMAQRLKQGSVGDLPGHAVPNDNLTILIGYGEKAFALPGAARPQPPHLGPQYRFRSALPSGGGPLLVSSGLSYASDIKKNPATEEIVLQVIADTELATSRVIVELWKILHDGRDPATGSAPLQVTSFFSGFQRGDNRSWIDFHDGLSNLEKGDQRRRVIAVKPGADAWTTDGTYLAYIRLDVDLAAWRAMSRVQQELLVGRDKLSGCPLVSVDAGGRPVPVGGCPAAGTIDVGDAANTGFREPPATADPVILQSHVQRANHHKTDFERPDSLRIYRQGYDFLECADEAPGFRSGLNFVSFQDTPERLLRLLTTEGWLGRTNFGGNPANQLPGMGSLLTVRAAGIYFVPPVSAGEPFPGASIFGNFA